MTSEDTSAQNTQNSEPAKLPLKCGLIMPISEMPGGYTTGHWADVQRLIKGAAEKAGFTSELVSSSDEVGIIHANIINNIYQNEMIICDVSGRNANVMFELGLRLASGLPVIIIKDETTVYTFDTGPIEYLEYRKDLRIFEMLAFQENLAEKIRLTYAASKLPTYKPFLDYFGKYTLAKVEDKTVELGDVLQDISTRLSKIEQGQQLNRVTSEDYIAIDGGNASSPIERMATPIERAVWMYLSGRKAKSSTEIVEMHPRVMAFVTELHPEFADKYGLNALDELIVRAERSYLGNKKAQRAMYL